MIFQWPCLTPAFFLLYDAIVMCRVLVMHLSSSHSWNSVAGSFFSLVLLWGLSVSPQLLMAVIIMLPMYLLFWGKIILSSDWRNSKLTLTRGGNALWKEILLPTPWDGNYNPRPHTHCQIPHQHILSLPLFSPNFIFIIIEISFGSFIKKVFAAHFRNCLLKKNGEVCQRSGLIHQLQDMPANFLRVLVLCMLRVHAHFLWWNKSHRNKQEKKTPMLIWGSNWFALLWWKLRSEWIILSYCFPGKNLAER